MPLQLWRLCSDQDSVPILQVFGISPPGSWPQWIHRMGLWTVLILTSFSKVFFWVPLLKFKAEQQKIRPHLFLTIYLWWFRVIVLEFLAVTSSRFVGKPERGSAMYFWLILTIFSGVNTNLGGWEAPEKGLTPPPPPTNRALAVTGVQTSLLNLTPTFSYEHHLTPYFQAFNHTIFGHAQTDPPLHLEQFENCSESSKGHTSWPAPTLRMFD